MFTIIGARCGCRRCQSWPEVPAKLFIACGGPSELFDPVTVKTGVHAVTFPEVLRQVAPGSDRALNPQHPSTNRRLSLVLTPASSGLPGRKSLMRSQWESPNRVLVTCPSSQNSSHGTPQGKHKHALSPGSPSLGSTKRLYG